MQEFGVVLIVITVIGTMCLGVWGWIAVMETICWLSYDSPIKATIFGTLWVTFTIIVSWIVVFSFGKGYISIQEIAKALFSTEGCIYFPSIFDGGLFL